MQQQVADATGKPGVDDQILFLQSETAAYRGQFANAQELARRAADSAQRVDEKETAAEYLSHDAIRQALVGNVAVARQQAQAALATANSKLARAFSAIAFGLAGDSAQAERIADDLNKRFPQDTDVQFDFLPMIHAGIAIRGGDGARAISTLTVTAPYELAEGNATFTFALYPVYLRGEAYLAVKQGTAAIVSFRRFWTMQAWSETSRSARSRTWTGARYTLSGDAAKARTAYQDFFALWKDADPTFPSCRR